MEEIVVFVTSNRWFLGLIAAAISVALLSFVRKFLVVRLYRSAHKTETIWDDVLLAVVQNTKLLMKILVAYVAASFFLTIPEQQARYFHKLAVILAFVQIAIWTQAALSVWWNHHTADRIRKDPSQIASLGLIGIGLRALLMIVLLLLCLNNLGIDITALVAGLGIGGVAVALAVQNILSDLFASLTIVMDKPFVIGDLISLGEWQGTVDHIGLKTTRVRSVSGEQLVFSNSDLLSSRLRNFKRMTERRVSFTTGVTYSTSLEQLQRIPKILEAAVAKENLTRFERSHLVRFNDSSIDFDTVYWVLSPEYLDFANAHQSILLTIFKEFGTAKVEFAFPTRTTVVERGASWKEILTGKEGPNARDIESTLPG